MHPTTQYEINKARIADWQRRASQNAITHAARRGHRPLTPQRSYLVAVLARRVVTLLAALGRPITARSRPRPGCQPSPPCHACA